MSRCVGKPTICIGEKKDADQLFSNCEADQRLSFRYKSSTIPLLSKSKISTLLPSSVTVQSGLYQTWSEPKLLVFSHTGSYGKGNTEILFCLALCKKGSKLVIVLIKGRRHYDTKPDT